MRYRPRATIRDCVFLVVIFALAVGWWVDHRRSLAARAKTQAELREAQAAVTLAELLANRQAAVAAQDKAHIERLRQRLLEDLPRRAQQGGDFYIGPLGKY